MNNDEFLKKLSEVCEWEIPDSVTGTLHKPKHRENYAFQEEETEEEELVIEEQNFPPRIIKLKQACDCEDCGKHLPDGRLVETRCVYTPYAHWRRRCAQCGLQENPNNKRIELPWRLAADVWTQYLREKKGKKFYPRPNARKDNREAQVIDLTETEDSIITKYSRDKE